MAFKTVLLRFKENRKKVVIPEAKPTSDLQFLESSFRKLFKFEQQINLAISFQRFDETFDELVDLEEGDLVQNREKLNVVVTPILITPPAVSDMYIRIIYTNEASTLQHDFFCYYRLRSVITSWIVRRQLPNQRT